VVGGKVVVALVVWGVVGEHKKEDVFSVGPGTSA
jgi:hypothetical protein